MVLAIGNGGGGQSTLPANQGDQRGASHRMMQGGGGGSNLSCQLPAAGATARATCDDVIVCWCDSLIVWLYDGVIVWWSDVKVIVVVVIGRGAATGDDDDDWDSNSAIVGLAVIRQSVAFPSQGESKRRWPPSCGLRPECVGTTFGHSGKCMWLGRQELKRRLILMVAVIVIATLQEQAVVLVIGNDGGGQSTLPAKQGDQRAAGHSMMQGGGGGSNLSCQLPAAGATATT